MRTWTNARTGEVVRGAFLAARPVDGVTMVSVERESGDVVVFAMTDLAEADRLAAKERIEGVREANRGVAASAAPRVNQGAARAAPPQAAPFDAFVPFVTTRWDDRWLYVESDGLPHAPGGAQGSFVFSHPMMVGITAWQQQVPLPQSYRGENAWRIPLKPELAATPVSAKEQLFRGAIALAANGVPIFNPIKNDGRTDTFLAGELDEYGGHCGRADDYHYHIAPTHLQKYVGVGRPIAYALDGFPIYGRFDPGATASGDLACPLGSREKLDDLNGHHAPAAAGSSPGAKGLYHYHASAGYPYLNGGMRGVVAVKDDQIEPQPSATPVRSWLQPLRGAKITGFKPIGTPGVTGWVLQYAINGKPGSVSYRIEGRGEDATYVFEFVGADGTKSTETYKAAERRGGGGARGGAEGPRRAQPEREPRAQRAAPAGLKLTSEDVTEGRLNVDCTCDGAGRAPLLEWTEPPKGTRALALVMHHIPPDGGAHVYMVVANLPAGSRRLRDGDASGGAWGQNTVNRKREYAPPCSQGPGEKSYTITLYALSAAIPLTPGKELTRETLLAGIQDTTLATAELPVTFARVGAPQPREAERRGAGRGGVPAEPAGGEPRERGLLERATSFKTDVPAVDASVILARPTDRTITVSVAVAAACDAVVEYWRDGSTQRLRTAPAALGPGAPANIELPDLAPGAEYQYRLGRSGGNARETVWGEPGRFHTRRGKRDSFAFVVQADSHLDQGVEPAMYEQTLANMLAAEPDFVIDLGDTFMTDKRGQNFQAALPQYDAQRYYLSRVAHAAPLFMVLGNHDGEKGTSGREAADIGPWSYMQRTTRFPEPRIDGTMYTGNTAMEGGVGSNYYAFEWGDALFVVLDPYWRTTDRVRGGGNRGAGGGEREPGAQRPSSDPLKPTDASWTSTLGRPQYDWLARTLAASKVAYRFVFIHHLVGGLGGAESRGGVESSPFFEWGGKNADGTPGFAQRRPGWPTPIHDLLVAHKVSAVFHGHGHLYVRSERDGLVYQCVPQPGNPRGNTRTAAQYGYASGDIFGSPGHVRVRVGPDKATIEFVRSATQQAGDDRGGGRRDADVNGSVVHEYSVPPVRSR